MMQFCLCLYKCYRYFLLFIVVIDKYQDLNLHHTNSHFNLNLFNLNIVILSARENFDKRQIIRETWFKHIIFANELSIKYNLNFKINAHFVVGDRSCNIHPLNRWEIHGCDLINITEFDSRNFITNNGPKWLINGRENAARRIDLAVQFYNGFSFKVNQKIVLNKIGVLSKLIDQFGKVDVFLLDAYSKDLIYKDTLTRHSLSEHNFYYHNVRIPIEKHMTYILTIRQELDLFMLSDLKLNLHFNYTNFIFKIMRSYYGMHDYQSKSFNKDQDLFITNFEYELTEIISHDFENDKILSNYWLKKIESSNSKLLAESELFDDIIFVHMIDVYRNLPEKLLLYFQTYVKHRKKITHILKTDDDCYLNIFNIVRLLIRYPYSKRTWFGNFRKNWLVNYYGKWTDDDFTAYVYPQFACGSGYILTRYLVDWLILNAEYLHRYQGEDVSLGIWLSSIHPSIVEDKMWLCGNEDAFEKNNILSVPQVRSELMFELYTLTNKINGL